MTAYIDIHSHSEKQADVQYILVTELKNPNNSQYFVNGVHPWDLKTKIDENILFQNYKSPKYLGLGEVGLDKLTDDFELQIKRFTEQVALATKYNINFIVLHNIKSTQEILKILKDSKFKGTLLLHGFNASKENFEQFQRHFETYISCGEQILKGEKLLKVLENIPIEHIFFETDDSKVNIQTIYYRYAEHNNLNIEELKRQMSNNFTKLMKNITIHY